MNECRFVNNKNKPCETPYDYHGVAFMGMPIMVQDGNITDDNALAYEFTNLGNCPVLVNGVYIDRYFSGTLASPTYLQTKNFWIPDIKSCERDTSTYAVQFLPNLGGTTIQRLQVIKKVYSPPQINQD